MQIYNQAAAGGAAAIGQLIDYWMERKLISKKKGLINCLSHFSGKKVKHLLLFFTITTLIIDQSIETKPIAFYFGLQLIVSVTF